MLLLRRAESGPSAVGTGTHCSCAAAEGVAGMPVVLRAAWYTVAVFDTAA